ncbi:MAG: hypothetical protein HC890_19880 [Chloroflexaceae bacterium]|nr:hypothetical protein [Chloroflexaceae bacterium]
MKCSAGVIAERGGLTSHAAIIARELNIPAVVGAAHATKLLATGDPLLLSGDRGEVYRLVEGEALPAFAPESQRPRLPLSPPPLGTQLLVNLSQPNSIARAAQLPVDGVGLLRSELMLSELLSSGTLADWLAGPRREVLRERLVDLVSQFAAAFAPRPVFYRSTDWRAGEFAQLFPESSPSHLGRGRGTYRYLEDPAWFELELGALGQVLAAGFQNVHLLLPFVRSLEEFCFVRDRVQQLPMRRQGLLQLWIVAEVPSVLYLLPDYVKAGVQGIAIGSNDLMQLLLGVDRDGDFRETPLNVTHPAFLAALKQLIEQAQQLGIPCSFCGQAVVEDPSLVERLVNWGISALSVEPDAVESTYWALARPNSGYCWRRPGDRWGETPPYNLGLNQPQGGEDGRIYGGGDRGGETGTSGRGHSHRFGAGAPGTNPGSGSQSAGAE